MIAFVLVAPLNGSAQELDIEVGTPDIPTETFVEDFSLTERSGKTVSRADLKGRPWLACFIFTRCTATCSKVTASMAELSRALKDTDVQLVSITVDPAFDTPDELKRYAKDFRADPERWWFLTGDKQEIFHLIHNSFGQQLQENPKAPVGLQVTHSNNVMHIDASGRVVGKYNAIVPDEMTVLRQVLLKGKETPKKHRYVPPVLGIRIGGERLAPELATTSPPDANDGGNQPDADPAIPDWVRNLPTVNASLNGLATVLLLLGYGLISLRKVTAHRNVMLLAFGVSVAFLACYLVYHYYAGSKSFAGSGLIRPVYFIILISHIILAVPVPVLAGMTIYRGLRDQREQHRRIAKITYPIWLYVSVTGVIIYVLLYHWPQ